MVALKRYNKNYNILLRDMYVSILADYCYKESIEFDTNLAFSI